MTHPITALILIGIWILLGYVGLPRRIRIVLIALILLLQ